MIKIQEAAPYPDYSTLISLKKAFGLPLHLISKEEVKRSLEAFQLVVDRHYPAAQVCFAVKSNPCRGAVRLMAELGAGIDSVSEYELLTALEEGIPPARIVCNGNAKTDRYLRLIVSQGCLCAVDNLHELDSLNALGKSTARPARILIRVSGMPLEGLTSADQSTAGPWTKFGFPHGELEPLLERILKLRFIDFEGFSAHIGTQICHAYGYDRLFDYLIDLAAISAAKGLPVKTLDLGGGYPLNYLPKADWLEFQARLRRQLRGELPTSEWVTWDNAPLGYTYLKGAPPPEGAEWIGKAYWTEHPGAEMFKRILTRIGEEGASVVERLKRLGTPRLIVEPGRALLSSAGCTAAEVVSTKKVLGNYVVALDMGIVNQGTNLITPDIFPVEILPRRDDDTPVEAFLAGRLCFTGDMISKVKVKLNRLPLPGDLALIKMTGAYCADHFASNSCGFPRPAKLAFDSRGIVEVWRKTDKPEDVFSESFEAS